MSSTDRRSEATSAVESQSQSARFVQPLILKQNGLFLLCSDDGDIRSNTDQGLYFHDMRYLSRASLLLDGEPLVSLLADASAGHRAVLQLTNPQLDGATDEAALRKETLGIRREKLLGDDYVETITVENYARAAVDCTLQFGFEADFADMFVVRGMTPGRRGTLHAPDRQTSTLVFRYDGADGHERTTALHFSRVPQSRRDSELTFRLRVEPRRSWRLEIKCKLRDRTAGSLEAHPRGSAGATDGDRQRARAGALGHEGAHVDTSNPLFNAILCRSFMDLHMLRMRQEDQVFFAAGVPWYVALFGRDTLITSLEVLAFEPQIAANTLRVLARYQAKDIDDERDAQPGKILHELRVDEMANLNEIPQTPYYGSVDSTPLFLVLLGRYSACTGSLDLFHELRDHACAALEWIERFGDSDGDGFIDYRTRSSRGGRNQGWKDSGNAIVMADGCLAEPPIALPEVQGLVYLAWQCMADLFERDGDAQFAQRLRQRAQELYARFNRAFWLSRQRYYALCRQADGRFSTAIASNAAHSLWTGIVEPRRAPDVARRSLRTDLFSGWGIRTLSARDRSYNPLDYQVGSVWPHDNAMIVAGMQRYGCANEAAQVFTAMVQAAAAFDQYRLPEVFAGYDRGIASSPVKYPVACNPQAWSAGAIPYMLTSVLGLHPDGFNHRLDVTSPALPEWLDWVTVHDVAVGQAHVDLRFDRSPEKTTTVTILRNQGQADIRII